MRCAILRRSAHWGWLLLAIPVAFGLHRVHLDTEMLDLLPRDDRVAQGLRLYQQHFANARELIVSLTGPDGETVERAASTLGHALEQDKAAVAGVVWQAPWLEHPDQMGELIGYLWFNQKPQLFGELTNRLRPDQLKTVLEQARERLATSMSPTELARQAYDPYGLMDLPEAASAGAPSMTQGSELFSSADGKYRVLFVESALPLASYRQCASWLKTIENRCQAALNRDPALQAVTLQYTGRPAFVAEASSGMEKDVSISVFGTSAIIALLFWLAHRRWRPMLWLLALLALILLSTFAVGGLIFGNINVVSMGFAAILLGLAVDYAVIHYQESLVHPLASISQIRRAIAPSIFWAAVTTISSFLVLNLGGLPGLDQLGSLVALGVALSALVMIFAFLPPLFPDRRQPKTTGDPFAIQQSVQPAHPHHLRYRKNISLGGTAAIVIVTIVILVSGPPGLDASPNALRPAHSPAYEALDQMQQRLGGRQDALWLLISGPTVEGVHQVLEKCQSVLARAKSNQLVASFVLPVTLWPEPRNQQANRLAAAHLAAERDLLNRTALEEGFATNALVVTDRILQTWSRATASPGVFWPTNQMSRWILDKLTSRSPQGLFAMGLVYPNSNRTALAVADAIRPALPNKEVWVSGWGLLGHSIWHRVFGRLPWLISPIVILVLVSLWLAFHRKREVLLSLSVLGLSGLCVLAIMRGCGWKWNLMNLMGVPLILGTGVDYSIFMQLALKRYHGNLTMAHNSVGRALFLCGGTATAGFGSLILSSNAGMASLGEVCAIGIASNMLISVLLLPIWWKTVVRATADSVHHGE
jgi:predicted RND superfamily exporter protein